VNFVILQDSEHYPAGYPAGYCIFLASHPSSFVPLKSIENGGYWDPKNIASSRGSAKYYSWAPYSLIELVRPKAQITN